MKSVNIFLPAIILLLTYTTFAGNLRAIEGDDIEQTVVNYVKNIDNQNVAELNKTILPDASFSTYNQITNNLENYNSSKFMSMVKDGQIGGWKRNVNVGSVSVDGNTAVAKLDISDPKILESGFVTLVKDNGTWKIASQVSNLQLNKQGQAGATQK